MIFVTVGTNEATFDRLLHGLDGVAGDEELVVQHGPSPVRPAGATCVPYLPFDELTHTVRRARVVITHAGVGSVMTALLAGRRPVVVPRLRAYGEAVDDHQVAFGRRLDRAGLVTLAEDTRLLAAAARAPVHGVEATLRPDRRLVGDLRDLLEQVVGGPP